MLQKLTKKRQEDLLRRLRPQLTVEAARSIYMSMVIPLFTNCSLIMGNTNNTYKKRIEAFEARANRLIYGNQLTNLPSIEFMLKKKICMYVFNCLHENVFDPMKAYFDVLENKTRNNGKLIRVPKIKLQSTKKSFYSKLQVI